MSARDNRADIFVLRQPCVTIGEGVLSAMLRQQGSGCSGLLTFAQRSQPLRLKTGRFPFQKRETVIAKEMNRWLIPVEHIQHDAEAVFVKSNVRNMSPQRIPNLFPAKLLPDV